VLSILWIAFELSIPKIGLNITLSLTLKKLHAFKFDRVAESDNTAEHSHLVYGESILERSIEHTLLASIVAFKRILYTVILVENRLKS